MEYADVVFPLNLRPLTYAVPEALRGSVAPGVLVGAELKSRTKRGVVLRPASSPGPEMEKIKGLTWASPSGPALDSGLLKLLFWMSDYYFSIEGLALKSMFPKEFFEEAGPRSKKAPARGTPAHPDPPAPPREAGAAPPAPGALTALRESIAASLYGAFLLHAPSSGYELSFLEEALKSARRAIVLLPGQEEAAYVAGRLVEAFKDRVALYHAGLRGGGRSEALQRVLSGSADIVVGSRSAVFAPLRDVSLIAVLGEESQAYKAEGGLRYNARDMAVVRGFLSGATVLLSSPCPSVESVHNARTGKYTLLDRGPGRQRRRVRMVDMRGKGDAVSATLRRAVDRAVAKGGKVVLYVNRKGFSMLECGDCGRLEACPECGVPLVFHKGRRTLRCGCCAKEKPPPMVCPHCGCSELRHVGAGMERVEEELEGLGPVGVDKKRKRLIEVISEADSALAVGTKALTRSAALRGRFLLAGIINADAYLYVPDFRSTERAFEDLVRIEEMLGPGGELVLQTRNPGSALFADFKRRNDTHFYDRELAQRRELDYPPFSRLALVTVKGPDAPQIRPRPGKVEVLGPARVRGGWKLLLKARSRGEMRPVVRELLSRLGERVSSLDIDPVSL